MTNITITLTLAVDETRAAAIMAEAQRLFRVANKGQNPEAGPDDTWDAVAEIVLSAAEAAIEPFGYMTGVRATESA